MILCEVNVQVNAAIEAAEHHRICLDAVKAGIAAGEVFAANAIAHVAVTAVAYGVWRWREPVVAFDPEAQALAAPAPLEPKQRVTVAVIASVAICRWLFPA